MSACTTLMRAGRSTGSSSPSSSHHCSQPAAVHHLHPPPTVAPHLLPRAEPLVADPLPRRVEERDRWDFQICNHCDAKGRVDPRYGDGSDGARGNETQKEQRQSSRRDTDDQGGVGGGAGGLVLKLCPGCVAFHFASAMADGRRPRMRSFTVCGPRLDCSC